MKILLSQKNELFKVIESNDSLNLNQFSLSENSDNSSSVTLKGSDYFFSIFKDEEYHKSFFINYVPGEDTYREISGHVSWAGILLLFNQWIQNILRETNEPNYWEELKTKVFAINFSPNPDNSKLLLQNLKT